MSERTVTITNEYGNGNYTWIETDRHCFRCGVKGVWRDDDDDYYAGYAYVCLHCKAEFSIPCDPGDDDGGADAAAKIKEKLPP